MPSLRSIGLSFPLALALMTAPPAMAASSDKPVAGKPVRPAPVVLGAPRDRVTAPLIVGGTPAAPNDNPFQVGLLQKGVPSNFDAQFCGGTLIAPNVVVTAAHCGFYQATPGGISIAWRPDQVQVLTGTRDLNQGGARSNVALIVNHPKYDPKRFDYDVAVWKLAAPVQGVPLAQLATSDGTPGSNMLVTGWGATSEGGKGSPLLLKVSLPIVSHAACSAVEMGITPRMLCAGFKSGDRASCQGDSGGPGTRGPGNKTLTGIVSWGVGCARPGHYDIYTRVSDPSIRDFIRANMN